jgi:xanthine dehydrogenase YagS FAD-binding subunit
MKPFQYIRAIDQESALQALAPESSAAFIAGGTNLVDLMREGVEKPDVLVDINRLDHLARIEELSDGILRLGALAKNSETANHPLVRENYPLLSEAILAGASAQLRNSATNGGNLMQRTRCYYFYDTAMPCNKREPGSGCGAIEGFNRIHAIFGASDKCIATHPSDMCVALSALDAIVQVAGPQGSRSIQFEEFYRLPEETPQIDTNLKHDELITSIDLHLSSRAYADHSYYLKVRDRASYAFALVSVAAALDIQGGVIKRARVAMGGVAPKPWRCKQAEAILTGAKPDISVFMEAADIEMRHARAYEHNYIKIELGRRSIVRGLSIASNR